MLVVKSPLSLLWRHPLVIAAALLVVAPPTVDAAAMMMRKNIVSLTEAELLFYRLGVQQLRLRPLSDPTNWFFQANFHGFPRNITHQFENSSDACTQDDLDSLVCEQKGHMVVPTTAVCPALYEAAEYTANELVWEKCQHGTFYFLPWHRLYLTFFERILHEAGAAAVEALRVATDLKLDTSNQKTVVDRLDAVTAEMMDSMGLPYWDYSNEGEHELERAWSLNDTKMPTALTEGLACDDGSERGVPASPLVDVVLGRCNPLHISGRNDVNPGNTAADWYGGRAHRSAVCNSSDGYCAGGQSGSAPSGVVDPLAGLYQVDARPALSASCSFECSNVQATAAPGTTSSPDPCPPYACVHDDYKEHASFHGGERDADSPDIIARDDQISGSISGPHSAVHGGMGRLVDPVTDETLPWATFGFGYMAFNACAARDPAFYLHHCNIDRLWQMWLNVDDSHRDPIETSGWQQREFFFHHPNGSLTSPMTPCDSVSITNLGYAFYYTDPDTGATTPMPVQNVRACTIHSSATVTPPASGDTTTDANIGSVGGGSVFVTALCLVTHTVQLLAGSW